MTDLSEHLHSAAFAAEARSPDHPSAFTRSRKLPLPTLLGALLSFRGGSVQSELDAWAAAGSIDTNLVVPEEPQEPA